MADKQSAPPVSYDPVDNVSHVWGPNGEYLGVTKGEVNALNYQEMLKNVPGLSTAMQAAKVVPGLGSAVQGLEKGKGFDFKQFGKDLAVDAATQLPLMAIPGGPEAKGLFPILKRFGLSSLTGYAAGRALNKDKDNEFTSALKAMGNTAVAMGIPGMIENKPIDMFTPSTMTGGWGLAANLFNKGFGLLKNINPTNWEPRTVTNPEMIVNSVMKPLAVPFEHQIPPTFFLNKMWKGKPLEEIAAQIQKGGLKSVLRDTVDPKIVPLVNHLLYQQQMRPGLDVSVVDKQVPYDLGKAMRNLIGGGLNISRDVYENSDQPKQ